MAAWIHPSAFAPNVDSALEDCEDALLRVSDVTNRSVHVDLSDFELLIDFDLHELGLHMAYAARETII